MQMLVADLPMRLAAMRGLRPLLSTGFGVIDDLPELVNIILYPGGLNSQFHEGISSKILGAGLLGYVSNTILQEGPARRLYSTEVRVYFST